MRHRRTGAEGTDGVFGRGTDGKDGVSDAEKKNCLRGGAAAFGGGSSSAGVKYSGSSGAKPVKTSDPSDVTLWTGMLAGSALLLSLMAALKRKSK